jgi:hypothetical protein
MPLEVIVEGALVPAAAPLSELSAGKIGMQEEVNGNE